MGRSRLFRRTITQDIDIEHILLSKHTTLTSKKMPLSYVFLFDEDIRIHQIE